MTKVIDNYLNQEDFLNIKNTLESSGFYFLKCSNETSYPVFYDPRSSKSMNMLKQKDDSKLTYSTEQVHFKIKPGTLLFFNSYLTHEFVFDKGIEPFRFIHFNIQATDKNHAI